MPVDLTRFTVTDLPKLSASIIDELIARKVVRTRNKPLGDYTEWLVAKVLKLELASKSTLGHDGTDRKGTKYEIKGRRVTPENTSRQLSVIRKLEDKNFDFLVGVIFNEDYEILVAVMVPHNVVGEYASFREHVNGHILQLKGAILEDSRVSDISGRFNI